MASQTKEGHVSVLASNATRCIEHGDYSGAAVIARQLLAIAPDDPRGHDILHSIREQGQKGRLIRLCTSFVKLGNEADGKIALQLLKAQAEIPSSDLEQCAALLLACHDDGRVLLDELTANVFTSDTVVRNMLGTRFREQANNTFNLLWLRGIYTFTAFTDILLDVSTWSDLQQQKAAQRDAFQLAAGMVIDAGNDTREWAVSLMARLLATTGENLKDLLDEDIFDIVLTCLDIHSSPALRGQATLATVKLLEVTEPDGERMLAKYITSNVALKQSDNLIHAFSAAAAVFPVVPRVAAELFLTEGFLQGLIPTLKRNSDALGRRKSHQLEHAALELMSASCIDRPCREAISKLCLQWLRDIAESSSETDTAALAALVLAKIRLETKTDVADLSAMLSNMAIGARDDTERQCPIEGLAYTSLNPKVKENILSNTDLFASLVQTTKKNASCTPTVFGALTIFANIAAYRPVESEEQKRMSQLKAYANSAKPASEDPLDDDAKVTARCRRVLDAGIVPVFPGYVKTASMNALTLMVQIIYSIAKEQKHRGQLAQQGAVRVLLQLNDSSSGTATGSKPAVEATSTQRLASHALARILISVNPTHAFSSALPAASALRPLLSLLAQDSSSEERDLLPTFEALLALTNLASTDDNGLRETMIRSAWTPIEDLLLSSNKLVQRAAVELICNLMAAPSGVAKFANGSKQASNRMHILLALADAEDLATRRAAGGALAMLTEWDAAVEAVLSKERGLEILLGMCEDEGDEMKHRGGACVLNVISAPGEVGRKGLERVRSEKGVQVLRGMLQGTKSPEVLRVGVEALKKLV